MKKKTIERIAVLSVAGAIMLSMGGIVLSSYTKYKTSYDSIMSKNISEDNLNFRSVEVNLKDGVEYFDNGLASPTKKDFIVKALYGGTYAAPLEIVLEDDEYELVIDKSFSITGGKIVAKYNGKESTPLNIKLTKVIPTSLTIKEKPYTVTYAVNDIFSKEGMIVEAIYNDGNSKEISSYTVSNVNPLTKKDKEIIVSYQEGETTVTTKLPITVLDTVDNGDFVTLDVGENYVEAGTKLTTLERVLGTYNNGNKKYIPSTDYIVESDMVATLGLEYKARVSLISNPNYSAEIKAHVVSKVNASSFECVNVGTTLKDIATYEIDDNGNFVSTGTIKVNNGGFKTKYTEYKPTVRKSLKTKYISNKHTDGDLWIRCGNYNWDGSAMLPANFEYMFDLYVNGRHVEFGNYAVIPGFSVDEADAKSLGFDKAQDLAFQTFFDVKLANVNLLNGINDIEMVLNLDDNCQLNTWSEVADIKIDNFSVVVNKDVPVHTLKHNEGNDAGCNASGEAEHYACTKCGETFADEEGSEIMLDTSISSGKHDYGKYTITEDKHSSTCSICGDIVEEEHNFDTSKYNETEHWKECVCGKKTDVSAHSESKLQYYFTKTYNIGETIDQSAINISYGCECGFTEDLKSQCQLTFNETTASINSKATFIYEGTTYTIPLPIKYYQVEAENCNISGDTANYQLSYEEYEIEAGVGKNKTDIVGTKSTKGDRKLDENKNPIYGDTSITITIYSDTNRKLSMSMLGASTFDGNKKLSIEDACDLTVNGESKSFASDASFKGGGEKWFGWEDVHIADIDLVQGKNEINILVNYASTLKQTSGQGPFNIDYFYFQLIN